MVQHMQSSHTFMGYDLDLFCFVKVFEEIRTMHVGEVFGHLKSVVANMKNIYEVILIDFT